MLRAIGGLCVLGQVAAQLPGNRKEVGPALTISECGPKKCKHGLTKVTLDADWRWFHDAKGRKPCYSTATDWDPDLCPDPDACAANCALEGISERDYRSSYGISSYHNGLQLKYLSRTKHTMNYGSRVFVMDGPEAYRLFHLKNREIAFDVDVSRLPCGVNGALYFVEMAADGNKDGSNAAGAKYGTGYCDAQCPQDVKFISGEINMQDWDATTGSPFGKYGSCCTEMDIWEANSMATAMTAHPCSIEGQAKCAGSECGVRGRAQVGRKHTKGKGKKGKRAKKDVGLCDPSGCDFNPSRLAEDGFWGPGNNYTVDSSRPVTIVTQFLTSDGTDDGELVEVRRFYVQDRTVIPNSNATILGDDASDSISTDYCQFEKQMFKEPNRFAKKGGLKAIGDAFDRGMVLVMSLWDDALDNMNWLDATFPADHPNRPGALRGPCAGGESSTPDFLHAEVQDAFVTFTNIAVGEIGTTVKAGRRLRPTNWV